MAANRDTFIDPMTGDQYEFHVNHNEEQPAGRQRAVQHGAPTSGQGLVSWQGVQTPLTLHWRGVILHAAQHEAMWDYVERCNSRTIQLKDFHGDQYEILITSFQPVRVRGENKNDSAIPHHFYNYDLEMEVRRVISGSLHTAGVTP